MKKILLVLFPLYSYSQDGTKKNDTLILDNGAKFYVGQKIKVGYSSHGNRDFQFIHLSPYSIAGPVKLSGQWAGHEMTVKSFELGGSKNTGKTYYLVLKGGNLSPYWCEITAAIDQGEIIVEGINDKKTLGSGNGPQISVADELTKLNKLYKDSIITKEEYEAQKKKLLSK